MRDLVVIAHDMRSSHNVGSLLRTAEGLGVTKVYLTGYTPYPLFDSDNRLPHMAQRIDKQIAKTALGAQKTQPWQHCPNLDGLFDELRQAGFCIAALEQTPTAIKLPDFNPPDKLALLLGREFEGIDQALLKRIAVHLEIPMLGSKESFNVVQAAAMALYHCRFIK